jgi:hypothetical protein
MRREVSSLIALTWASRILIHLVAGQRLLQHTVRGPIAEGRYDCPLPRIRSCVYSIELEILRAVFGKDRLRLFGSRHYIPALPPFQ